MIRIVILHIFQRRIGEGCHPCIITKSPIKPLSNPSMPREGVPSKPQVVQLVIIDSAMEGLHMLIWTWIVVLFLVQELYFVKLAYQNPLGIKNLVYLSHTILC